MKVSKGFDRRMKVTKKEISKWLSKTKKEKNK